MTLLLPARVPLPLDTVVHSDALTFVRGLPDNTVNCCITSPPYFGLRDYQVAGQIGLEDTPAAFVAKMVELFREVRRVLRTDGTCWVNLGDSYGGSSNSGGTGNRVDGGTPYRIADLPPKNTGLAPKNLLMIPARVAIALQDDGWVLRSEIVWHKPNPLPESVQDRPTKSHEMVYMLAKSNTTQFWTHPERPGVREQPEPDYRWTNAVTGERTPIEPADWREAKTDDGRRLWNRVNLWEGRDYWYDTDAIREPAIYGENRATFRGGGSYTNNRSFNNSGKFDTDGEIRERPEAAGRNKRSVWTISEPKVKLRSDLTPEKRAYVIGELVRRGLL